MRLTLPSIITLASLVAYVVNAFLVSSDIHAGRIGTETLVYAFLAGTGFVVLAVSLTLLSREDGDA